MIRDEKPRYLIKSSLITVLRVSIYLVSAADFRSHTAAGCDCLSVETTGRKSLKSTLCLKTRISYLWLPSFN